MCRLAALFLIVSSLYGQARLPAFRAESLSGVKLAMPGAIQGHELLLVIGFTHAAGPHCTEWTKRLEAEFRDNPAVDRYTVIFLEDAPRLVRGMAKSGIKSGTPKEQYARYLIVTEHEKEVKAAIGFAAPDDAYLVLADADGAIRWTSHGSVNSDAVQQIREQLRRQAASK